MVSRYIAIFLLVLLSGCATAPVQPVTAIKGIEIETLQGPVAIALDSKTGKMGGQGVLFYRKPDQFRLSVLAPFGQVLMDIIVRGDEVLYLLQSQNKGWRGTVNDLPESLGKRIWPLMRWVVEPPRTAGPATVRDFKRPDGTYEKVYYDAAGLVQRKLNAFGDEVSYSDYRIAEGVAMPNVIEVVTGEGSRLKLTFDDPEVNQPIADEIMNPALEGMEILPLGELKAF
jgi:outer membrane lipoprotein-sorting protein